MESPKIQQEIQNLMSLNRLPHAIILEGADAKTREEVALYLSQWAVCKSAEKPCGDCSGCIKAERKSHGDIYYAQKAGKTEVIPIEEIRKICSDAFIMPNESDTKVYVLYDADKMLLPACNAFLKILEEPPQATLFILTCQSCAALLPTILSRAVVFHLDSETESSSGENIALLANEIALAMIAHKEFPLLSSIGSFSSDKKMMTDTLNNLKVILRDSLVLSYGTPVISKTESCQKLANVLTQAQLISLLDIIDNTLIKINQNINMNLLTTWFCASLRRISWQR
ncbi:MAG: hypothetical protein Q8876_06365 [Bacillota bacterium]|nr:hypothetical protein [Bacillota bacterium]